MSQKVYGKGSISAKALSKQWFQNYQCIASAREEQFEDFKAGRYYPVNIGENLGAAGGSVAK